MSKPLVTALLVVGTVLLGRAAGAQPRTDAAAVDYATSLARGHESARGGDLQVAVDSYNRAAAVRAQSGEPHLFLAEVARVRGQLVPAIEQFREAERLAARSGADEDGVRAKALFGIAMVLEAQRELGESREAWQAYIRFSEAHTALPIYVPSARARIQAIDRVDELNQAYAQVRERLRGGRRGR